MWNDLTALIMRRNGGVVTEYDRLNDTVTLSYSLTADVSKTSTLETRRKEKKNCL